MQKKRRIQTQMRRTPSPPQHRTEALAKMRAAGRCAAATLEFVAERLEAGVTGSQINDWVHEDTLRRGARPSQLGFHGFPASVCVSRNEVVCHGVPHEQLVLRQGDIVNVDVTSELDGFHGDTSVTVAIGEPLPAARAVMRVAKEALGIGIKAAQPGAFVGDIGQAIERHVRAQGLGVVSAYGGHGIGERMHMPPIICHTDTGERGAQLRPGMTFTIEPMVTVGWPALRTLNDGWTVVTADGSPSAQFEHTVLITNTGVEVLTRMG